MALKQMNPNGSVQQVYLSAGPSMAGAGMGCAGGCPGMAGYNPPPPWAKSSAAVGMGAVQAPVAQVARALTNHKARAKSGAASPVDDATMATLAAGALAGPRAASYALQVFQMQNPGLAARATAPRPAPRAATGVARPGAKPSGVARPGGLGARRGMGDGDAPTDPYSINLSPEATGAGWGGATSADAPTDPYSINLSPEATGAGWGGTTQAPAPAWFASYQAADGVWVNSQGVAYDNTAHGGTLASAPSVPAWSASYQAGDGVWVNSQGVAYDGSTHGGRAGGGAAPSGGSSGPSAAQVSQGVSLAGGILGALLGGAKPPVVSQKPVAQPGLLTGAMIGLFTLLVLGIGGYAWSQRGKKSAPAAAPPPATVIRANGRRIVVKRGRVVSNRPVRVNRYLKHRKAA